MTAPTTNRPTAPDDHFDDRPIHRYFGLSYANYLVLHRTLMQSMPADWQQRMVACLEELDAAFDHVDRAPAYEVTPGEEFYFSDLADAEMTKLGVTVVETEEDEDGETWPISYLYRGEEYEPSDQFLVPMADPVPHYSRGRTYVEPRIEGSAA